MAARFPTAYSILFGLIIVVAALTWIIPAGQYDRAMNEEVCREIAVPGTYQTVEPNPQGFVDVMLAPVAGFYDPDSYAANAIDVALFVLLLGGFLGVVNATGSIDTGMRSAMRSMQGREIWMIPILMALFAIGGTTYGMAEETLVVYTVDNGGCVPDWADNGPLAGSKYHLMEGGTRVRTFVKMPGVLPEGRVHEGVFSCLDLAPTICELVGVATERGAFDGRSCLSHLSKNQRSSGRSSGLSRSSSRYCFVSPPSSRLSFARFSRASGTVINHQYATGADSATVKTASCAGSKAIVVKTAGTPFSRPRSSRRRVAASSSVISAPVGTAGSVKPRLKSTTRIAGLGPRGTGRPKPAAR